MKLLSLSLSHVVVVVVVVIGGGGGGGVSNFHLYLIWQ